MVSNVFFLSFSQILHSHLKMCITAIQTRKQLISAQKGLDRFYTDFVFTNPLWWLAYIYVWAKWKNWPHCHTCFFTVLIMNNISPSFTYIPPVLKILTFHLQMHCLLNPSLSSTPLLHSSPFFQFEPSLFIFESCFLFFCLCLPILFGVLTYCHLIYLAFA